MIRVNAQKITILKSAKPNGTTLNEELQWFGRSLGLFSLRDKDKSCFRVFIELLKSAKRRQPLSSDELSAKLNLTRGTVVHHINKLIETGIVIPESSRYLLRVDNLRSLIEEIEKDIERACSDLREVADDIDRRLNL